MVRGGKVVALSTVAGGLLVVAFVAIAVEGPIREAWHLKHLEDPSADARASAARRLAGFGSLGAIPALLALYDEEEWKSGRNESQVYFRAIEQIIRIRGQEALPALTEGFRHGGFYARFLCGDQLATFGPGAMTAMPSLIEALEDEEPWIRLVAVQALRAIGPSAAESIPSLVTILGDEDKSVAFNAASALLRIDLHNEAATLSMKTFLSDEDPGLRRAAQEALEGHVRKE